MRKRIVIFTFSIAGIGIIMRIRTGTGMKIGTGTMMKIGTGTGLKIGTVFQYWPSVHGLETLRTGVRPGKVALSTAKIGGLIKEKPNRRPTAKLGIKQTYG